MNKLEKEQPGKEFLENLSDFNKFNRQFLQKRKVFLWGGVDDDSARSVVNRLLYLEAEDPGKEITFYINSPGGIVTSGMVIYDTISMISSPVSTVCIGLAASMASILLSVGKKGKRYIWPNGRVLIHQPSIGGVIQGPASDLEIQAREIVRTKERTAAILAKNCGKKVNQVMEDFDRDYWMDAKESINYGIVDKIAAKIDF